MSTTAVTGGPLTAERLEALDAACDTLLPAIATSEPGPAGDLLRLGARERGIPAHVAAAIPGLPAAPRANLLALLDELVQERFADASLERRTARLRELGDRVPDGRFAVKQLKTMTFGLLFGLLGEDGRNAVWDAIGFDGPISAPPTPQQAPKTLPLTEVRGAEATLTADVVIVGSGAGGSVIAARLAQAGRSVLVLEAGPYRNEADFQQLESVAGEMYLGGGLVWSEHGELGLLAGSALGGGTVINSMVCLRTPREIRESWTELGLDGLDGDDWDGWQQRVWDALEVNTEATVHNLSSQRMIAGLSELDHGHEPLPRNASRDDDARFCGYCNSGCQQGCKRSTQKNYLRDAAEAGARFVVGCRVERVLAQDGRATGVEAVVRSDDGGVTRLRVDAPAVVVAAGGIESPALLLRSGIGGPAAGEHLRVHPAWMVGGVYEQPIRGWSGQIQSAASFDFTHVERGVGFLCETLGLSPGFWAGQSPFRDGAAHREQVLKLGRVAAWHGVSHDHGSGRVVLDGDGEALVRWSLADAVDHAVAVRAHVELARIHRAAGAREVFTFHWHERRWREGEDFGAFLDALRATPAEDFTAFSAHQMGSCRMGADPTTSVADGSGELHDVRGVWIGDAAALPTAPGVNPMITIMALAERTAVRMLEADA
ncbi:FAD-dependent oxidoreductase [Conexibacter woesei]|uniref:Glucose-methanol-choline oxidoreductase n=1 Tax=Conexibacter woesei (strain DSM 14684 / CCUG 47730 / CIP 108061 / JCM 11494 / NBRC 100937 / ID131577) TaxID=469383 RepID=D3F2N6_CONWI|nr:FAD-dependent oxidoreductase [Conexibacter woesei]ADB52302.1 glucose-methanol-choline oxidoreductase [Conexibacter woesei DSM 14684]